MGRTERAPMRSALITGATRGIGRGIALHLAAQGFGLTVTARRDAELETLTGELRTTGSPTVVHLAADMADRAALADLADLHGRTFGSMSALVLNAGVGTAGPLATAKPPRVDRTMAVNFLAPLLMVQQSLPLLRIGADQDPERGAKIIGLSSITGVYAEAGLAAYGASKAALISLLETVNAEESVHGVSATAIAPGYVDTDMSAWTTDTIPADEMITVADVVRIVDMVLGLSRRAVIDRVVVGRAGSGGHRA